MCRNFLCKTFLMKFHLLPICFLISIVVFTSCKTTLITDKPAESYQPYSYTPKVSSVSLPIEMKVSALEAIINRQLSGLLYQDTSLTDNGGDNLMVKAWKKENIRLGFENGQFVYRVPLKLWIKAGWKFEQFGLSLSDYRELNAEIALNFRTSVTINKDWSLTAKTTSDGYEWISRPVLKLGPVDVPITFIADLIIRTNKQTITSAIDQGLKQSLDLKSNLLDVWSELRKPMLLSEEYGLWLRLTPKAIYTVPLTGDKGIIRQTTTIEAIAECFTGKKPPVLPAGKLPDLTLLSKPGNDFQVNISSYINYPYLDSVTRSQLVNSSYNFGNRRVTITQASVYGNENKMIIATDVMGSITGKLYFEGIPAYRSSDSSIILKDLQFHLKTRNVLVKSASWLANSGIEKMISKNMSYPIGADIRETWDMMQQSLKKYDLGEGFYVTGNLNGLDVEQPVLAPGGIIAPVTIKGNVIVRLDQ